MLRHSTKHAQDTGHPSLSPPWLEGSGKSSGGGGRAALAISDQKAKPLGPRNLFLFFFFPGYVRWPDQEFLASINHASIIHPRFPSKSCVCWLCTKSQQQNMSGRHTGAACILLLTTFLKRGCKWFIFRGWMERNVCSCADSRMPAD